MQKHTSYFRRDEICFCLHLNAIEMHSLSDKSDVSVNDQTQETT